MSIQKDIEYLSAGVSELEKYLLSKELYFPIGLNLPQLTLGGILLAIARAGVHAAKFEAQVEAVRSKWRAAWDEKSNREVRARSEQWANYLAEYLEDPKAEVHLYSQNVRYRAMISLLGKAEDDSDALVWGAFKEGEFIWEEECAPNFPRKPFWYLYGILKE